MFCIYGKALTRLVKIRQSQAKALRVSWSFPVHACSHGDANVSSRIRYSIL